MMSNKHLLIASHYEKCLKFGDTPHSKVDWPNLEELNLRYKAMFEIIDPKIMQQKRIRIGDFGCGLSGFYGFLKTIGVNHCIDYVGIDVVKEYLDISKNEYPNNEYLFWDIVSHDYELGLVDYFIVNGVFTQKLSLSEDEMYEFLYEVLKKLAEKVEIGIAINFMSPFVDYKKNGAFHVPFDRIGNFITSALGRKFKIRHDFLPYEYAVYIYR